MAFWLAMSGQAQAATFSLKAVRVNPFCVGGADGGSLCSKDDDCDSLSCGGAITPTNTVFVLPGDVIECEVFASDWSPNGEKLLGWQVAVDTTGFTSGNAGQVSILDTLRPCLADADCDDLFVFCNTTGFCATPPINPDGVVVDKKRSDYIFAGFPDFGAINTGIVKWGAALLNAGPEYVAPPKYAGTLRLRASLDGLGVFTIPLLPAPASDMADSHNAPILPRVLEPLFVTVALSVDPTIIAADPTNCAIDARQPSMPDGTLPAGIDRFEFRFMFIDPIKLTTSDFSVRQVPSVLPAIGIRRVLANPEGRGADWLRVRLDRGISTERWTCLTFLASGQEVCVGNLPGDVRSDGLSDEADLVSHQDCLIEGAGFCELRQCDSDRNGVCDPRDLLRVVDLLGGAAEYVSWSSRSLAACPSGP